MLWELSMSIEKTPSNPSILDLLPTVFHSDVNSSIVGNMMDKFFTKDDTVEVNGTVTTNVDDVSRIKETTTHRQNFQLQPMLSLDIATRQQLASFKDIMNEASRLGIDYNKFNEWGKCTQHNFMPPIDIDKLVNYADYYWIGATDPDYITIKNRRYQLTLIISSGYRDNVGLSDLVQQYTSAIAQNDNALALQLQSEINTIYPNFSKYIEELLWIQHNDTNNRTYADGWDWSTVVESDLWDTDSTDLWDADFEHDAVIAPSGINYNIQTDDWSAQNAWIHVSNIVTGTQYSQLKKAEMPIIEYSPFIVMNSWATAKHVWKYRRTLFEEATIVSSTPTDAEIFAEAESKVMLRPFGATGVVVSGDVTGKIPCGITINASGFTYQTEALSASYNALLDETTILAARTLDEFVTGTIYFVSHTSLGDPFENFNVHWVYSHVVLVPAATPFGILPSEQLESRTTVIPSQGRFVNNYDVPEMSTYESKFARVYVNGKRMLHGYSWGTNSPLGVGAPTDGSMVNVLSFIDPIITGEIKVCVGASTFGDLKYENVVVNVGNTTRTVSLITTIPREQVKTSTNQYPLFDIFDSVGRPTSIASPIWMFTENTTYALNKILNRRIKRDGANYFFTHSLSNEDGNIFTYAENPTGSLSYNSIWKTDTEHMYYVPKYVDSSYQEVPIGAVIGDWELPKQMVKNILHTTKTELSSVEVFPHFTDILLSQPTYPWISDANLQNWRLSPNPMYGAGGLIKEMGGNFDLFASSMFVEGFNIPDVIKYARDQYAMALGQISNSFIDSIVDIISTDKVENLKNFEKFISDSIIAKIPNRPEFQDSTMFDGESGVKNWVPSLAKLGIVIPVEPQLLRDDRLGILEITHHDGHKSVPYIINSELVQLANAIRNLGNCFECTSTTIPSIASTTFGSIIYLTDLGVMYKNIVSYIGSTEPLNKVDGMVWLNINTQQLNIIRNGVSVPYSGSLWFELNLNVMHANVLLNIESKLFDITKKTNAQVISRYLLNYSLDDQVRFTEWCNTNNIATPYATTYTSTNPFSWNYSGVALATLTIPHTFASMPATWHTMYEKLYGTRYPHLEPWILQGYSTKPTWWDAAYASSVRKWSQVMWNNILAGIVPNGQMLPVMVGSIALVSSGAPNQVKSYQKIPVQQFDQPTIVGNYGPDALIPPFYTSTNPLDQDVVTRSALITTTPSQSVVSIPYTFSQEGPNEDRWRRSIDYTYDVVLSNYLHDPINFLQQTIGFELANVGGVNIDRLQNRIPSITHFKFHGEYISDQSYKVNGLNQIIVQYLRYKNTDISISDVQRQMCNWTPKLCYATASYVDNENVIVSASSVVDPNNYDIVVKKSPAVSVLQLTSLHAIVSQVGASITKYGVKIPAGKGEDWEFRVTSPLLSNIQFFKVQQINGLATTFNILDMANTTEFFYHYPMLDDMVFEYVSGAPLSTLGPEYVGIQGLINFIDGYAAYVKSNGFDLNNTEFAVIDDYAGRTMNWQTEIEKMVEAVYLGMSTDQLPNPFAGKWSYLSTSNGELIVQNNIFDTGDLVQFNTTGELPVPFILNAQYLVDVDSGSFKLKDVETGEILIPESIGRGTMSVGMFYVGASTTISFHEINPFKQSIVVKHDTGVLADINKGSFSDSITNVGVYDQYGRFLDISNIRIIRRENLSFIRIVEGAFNSINPAVDLYLGGAKLSIDGYEHVIRFNNTDDAILYDDFLGIFTRKLRFTMRTKREKNMKPTVGGKFLIGGKQLTNIEASASSLQNMYDTYKVNENSDIVQAGRALVGYEPIQYLKDMGITPKSQFLFYKAMIQQKGSTNAINAFINLKRLIDARVDEYWAYRINSFGSQTTGSTEIWITPVDTSVDELTLSLVNDVEYIGFKWLNIDNASIWRGYPLLPSDVRAKGYEINSNRTILHDDDLNHNQLIVAWDSVVDDINVQLVRNPKVCEVVVDVVRPNIVLDIGEFIPNTKCVTVSIQRANVTYTPYTIIEHNNGTVDVVGIRLGDDSGVLEVGDIVVVVIGNSTLMVDAHYQLLNLRTIKLDATLFSSYDFDSMPYRLVVSGTTVDVENIGSVKVVDVLSKAVVEVIHYWDPINNYHHPMSDNIVDYQGADPAKYTHIGSVDQLSSNSVMWMDGFVGTVWLDTSLVKYKPYHDSILFSHSAQKAMWGNLEDWSSVTAYEWTQSVVRPQEYVGYAESSGLLLGTPKYKVQRRFRQNDGTFIDNWTTIDTFFATRNLLTDVSSVTLPSWVAIGDTALIVVNGVTVKTIQVAAPVIDLSTFNINAVNYVTLVVPRYNPTDEDLEFDPTIKDDLSKTVQYRFEYDYVQKVQYAENGIDEIVTYYFWTTDTYTSHNSTTLQHIEQEWTSPTTPWFAVMDGKHDKMVFKGLFGVASDVFRYVIRFTKFGELYNDNHSQWRLIRLHQSTKIDQLLWDRLVDTCVGYDKDLNPIPSTATTIYDANFNQLTRYGIAEGQCLLDIEEAIALVTAAINDSDFDLFPVDRSVFWTNFNFDSPSNVRKAMNEIYNTFGVSHVNRIWFTVLYASLSKNLEYVDIIKTSWVQLDSIRILDTTGVL